MAGILVGWEDEKNAEMFCCANYGDITSNCRISGLIDSGNTWNGELIVNNSYNVGNLSGVRVICGIGYVGTIKNCYNLGNLTGIGQVDGRTHYCSYYFERNPNKLS